MRLRCFRSDCGVLADIGVTGECLALGDVALGDELRGLGLQAPRFGEVAAGLRQRCLGAGKGNLGELAIEFEQDMAALNVIASIDQHRSDESAEARRQPGPALGGDCPGQPQRRRRSRRFRHDDTDGYRLLRPSGLWPRRDEGERSDRRHGHSAGAAASSQDREMHVPTTQPVSGGSFKVGGARRPWGLEGWGRLQAKHRDSSPSPPTARSIECWAPGTRRQFGRLPQGIRASIVILSSPAGVEENHHPGSAIRAARNGALSCVTQKMSGGTATVDP